MLDSERRDRSGLARFPTRESPITLAGSATLLALPGGSHTSAQHDPKVHRVTVDWLLARLDEADVAT